MSRALAPLLLVFLSVVVGCASSPPPWKVGKGEERRFRRTLDVCHKLTDASEGRTNPEAFEACMNRRGFRRQYFFEGWFDFHHTIGGNLPTG